MNSHNARVENSSNIANIPFNYFWMFIQRIKEGQRYRYLYRPPDKSFFYHLLYCVSSAILLSGGYVDYEFPEDGRPGTLNSKKFIELWSGGNSCNLPPLPHLTYGHSHDGDWVCGGWDGDWAGQTRQSCHVWAGGRWQTEVILVREGSI